MEDANCFLVAFITGHAEFAVEAAVELAVEFAVELAMEFAVELTVELAVETVAEFAEMLSASGWDSHRLNPPIIIEAIEATDTADT
jgi:hypothetical protein